MATAHDLVDTLNSFTSAGELKQFLAGYGVKGWKQDESSCPISNWVRSQIETTNWATVVEVITEDQITVYTDFNDGESYKITDVVNEFINNFDEGMYPELEFEYEEYWD